MITNINEFKKRHLSDSDKDFISNKIKLLMDEGRPQKQAIAMAYSYLDKKNESINEAVDIKSDIIDFKLLTQFATAIEMLCNGEYGYTFFNPETNYIAVCLGDANPFDLEELESWIKYCVKDYKNYDIVKVEIDCEWGPDTPYMFKNGKWTKK